MSTAPSLCRIALVSALALVVSACVTTPEQDPVVQRLSELDGRLLRIERVMSNQSLLDLSQRNDALQTELRSVRGQLEQLQHTLETTRNQQRELYADLDRRMQALEGGGAIAAGSAGAAAAGAVGSDDRAAYQAAFDLLKDGKYQDAANAFTHFLSAYPQSGLLDNAQYWLGEARYVMKDYPQALRDFQTVLQKYPESRKLPDALLKIGYSNYELKNWKEARDALGRVVQQFSDTTAARLAQQRLAKMDGEGR